MKSTTLWAKPFDLEGGESDADCMLFLANAEGGIEARGDRVVGEEEVCAGCFDLREEMEGGIREESKLAARDGALLCCTSGVGGERSEAIEVVREARERGWGLDNVAEEGDEDEGEGGDFLKRVPPQEEGGSAVVLLLPLLVVSISYTKKDSLSFKSTLEFHRIMANKLTLLSEETWGKGGEKR
jgi:hypothetical protein